MSALPSNLAAPGIGNASAASSSAKKTGGGFNELDSNEFLDIILTELSNQDPLAPNDTQALLEQLSSLRNIESQISLEESLEKLVLQNSLSQAGSLIGKVVEGVDANSEKVSGQVTSVRVADGEATLQLDTGRQLSLSTVSLISDPDA